MKNIGQFFTSVAARQASSEQLKPSQPTTDTGEHASASRNNALQKRHVSLSTGNQRDVALGYRARAGQFLQNAALSVNQIVQNIIRSAFGDKAHTALAQQTQNTYDLLSIPMKDSVLEKPGVADKLLAYAIRTGKNLSAEEIESFVATGERIKTSLDQGKFESPLSVLITGPDWGDKPIPEVYVHSNLHSARSLAWYFVALDIGMDDTALNAETPLETSDRSFIAQDKDNNVCNFLKMAPTCLKHLPPQIPGDNLGLHQSASERTLYGIDDPNNKMPGRGALLFDKLGENHPLQTKSGAGEKLYFRLENIGCPPVFSYRAPQGMAQTMLSIFPAIGRNISHALGFTSNNSQNAYKGAMQELCYQPVKALVDDIFTNKKLAFDNTLLPDIRKRLNKMPISAVIGFLKEMNKLAVEQEKRDVQDSLTQTITRMTEVEQYLNTLDK